MFKRTVLNILKPNVRFFTQQVLATKAKAIRFHEYGNPKNVLKMEEIDIPEVTDDLVRVKMLRAPINPADLNMINGTYGANPELPAIGGSEGVGIVEKVGPNVKNLSVGQHVILYKLGGSWTTHKVAPESDWQPVDLDNVKLEYGACLAINPCTAYRLLRDFVDLKKGDVIIQNGATSMVGHCVVAMGTALGCTTVNIMRERRMEADMIERIKYQGGQGTVVVTDVYAQKPNFVRLMQDLPRPKLALNCVGGDSARTLFKWLGEDGCMVTYGAMGRQPITVPAGPIIFKNISLRGFWLQKWLKEHSKEEHKKMLDDIIDMIKQQNLVFFIEVHDFSWFNHALDTSLLPQYDRKIVLDLTK